ncbi:hypothetical protein LJC19_04865 [Oxalobacter sp. OttesenSCG-928-P03]|nr:hypothetical protein [Oxalobacter sp. OttesenSCG-928-P03]
MKRLLLTFKMLVLLTTVIAGIWVFNEHLAMGLVMRGLGCLALMGVISLLVCKEAEALLGECDEE